MILYFVLTPVSIQISPKYFGKVYFVLTFVRNFSFFILVQVMSLRIYDPEIQQGSNPCKFNKGNCSHLCLPISPTNRVCRCATGFKLDPRDPTKCIGKQDLVQPYAKDIVLDSSTTQVKQFPSIFYKSMFGIFPFRSGSISTLLNQLGN